MKILFFYSSLLAFLFFYLSLRTLRLRRSLKVAVGDAGNIQMLRAMRVHSNFSEYVPLCLILIYFVIQGEAHPFAVHALGSALVVGRLSHAYGLSQQKENFKFRVTGMALTFTVLLSSASYLLLLSTGIVL